MNRYLRSALAGAATGGRTFTGLAALTLSTPAPPVGQPDTVLAKPWVKALVGLIAAQELVIDKLPATPSRLRPAPLTVRTLTGAGTGTIVARRGGPGGSGGPGGRPDVIGCALTAGVAAVAASWLGARWRQRAAPRLGSDFAAAALEDVAVFGLAYLGARP
jgi:uncharacterized membrane protein